ncbi:MAG: hypothetical protein R2800_07765 [Flavipsychrobacter sp.]
MDITTTIRQHTSFDLHATKQHVKFLSISALLVLLAFTAVQLITQLDGWLFGAVLALFYWMILVSAYFFTVLMCYMFRNKLVINADVFMKVALSISLLATIMVSIYVTLDILVGLTPYPPPHGM